VNPFDVLTNEIDELVDSFSSTAFVGDLNMGVTQYSFWMFVAVVVLLVLIFAFVKKQQASLVPQGRFVNGMEFLIEFTRDNICKSILGPTWKKHFPFLATLFLFVLTNNIIGIIPGMRPGTGCIGTTAAIACVSFVYFIVMGIRKHGAWGYVKSLAPKGVMFPINLLVWLIEVFSTILRLITLAVRLFCNMFAGHVVMATFSLLATLFIAPLMQGVSAVAIGQAGASVMWVAILIIIYLVEILVAAIQAYVFAMLSSVYVQIAESDEG
jgi:F-type H+-transporting ATPase subunit a